MSKEQHRMYCYVWHPNVNVFQLRQLMQECMVSTKSTMSTMWVIVQENAFDNQKEPDGILAALQKTWEACNQPEECICEELAVTELRLKRIPEPLMCIRVPVRGGTWLSSYNWHDLYYVSQLKN